MSLLQNELFFEQQAENCDMCRGVGYITVGEFDDHREEKCLCQLNPPEHDEE